MTEERTMADLKALRRRLDSARIPYDKSWLDEKEEEIWQSRFPDTIPCLDIHHKGSKN